MDSLSARKLIERCFPQLKIKRTRQILTGWENIVLEINGEYVFRIPKYKETENRLKGEIEILPKLRAQLSTAIPDYQFVWKGTGQYRHWFGGYPKLDGVTLSNRALRKAWNHKMAIQVSTFLKELHTTGLETKTLPIPTYSKHDWLKVMRISHKRIRRTVYPLLNPKTRASSDRFWRALFEDLEKADYTPTLIHGDLGSENILFDPLTHKLTGVLDWSYVQIGDPALEFSHLYIYDNSVGRDVLDNFGSLDSNFEKRVQFYENSEPYYDIMWGVTHRWDRARNLGMRNLRNMIREWS